MLGDNKGLKKSIPEVFLKDARTRMRDSLCNSLGLLLCLGNLFGLRLLVFGDGGFEFADALAERFADERQFARVEAIILSMTPEERANPDLLNPSRKKRIAMGAGVDISEVNKLSKMLEQMKKMMKQFGGSMPKAGKRGKFKFPFSI